MKPIANPEVDGASLIHPTCPTRYHFFLGGHDLEMVTISELLARHTPCAIHDKQLRWGAKASDYHAEIAAALEDGSVPVLIELIQDLELPPDKICIIDHHGPQAGHDKPTSLEQVFALLNLPDTLWNRHLQLVAANDRGYIPAMLELDASRQEIESIRQQDRHAQGITAAEEQAATVAVQQLDYLLDGRLIVAHLPHNKTAALVDRLQLGQLNQSDAGCGNILVFSPREVNFFGNGEAVYALASAFPGGWYGGDLPIKGFWGLADGDCPRPGLITVLEKTL